MSKENENIETPADSGDCSLTSGSNQRKAAEHRLRALALGWRSSAEWERHDVLTGIQRGLGPYDTPEKVPSERVASAYETCAFNLEQAIKDI